MHVLFRASLYLACWLTMTRETCPSPFLSNFSSPSRGLIELPTPVRSGSARSFDPFSSSRSRELRSRSCNLAHSLGISAHKDVIAIITIITVVIAVIVSPWTRAARKVVPDGNLQHLRTARPNILTVSEIVYTLCIPTLKIPYQNLKQSLLRKFLIAVVIFHLLILNMLIIEFQILHRSF